MEKFNDLNDSEIKNFEKTLNEYGIDISGWGSGESKTVNHLFNEILKNESKLNIDNSGELIRKVQIACSAIYYNDPSGRSYRLLEKTQVFKDGRTRNRTSLDGLAVFEKMLIDETPENAIIRGISEELGINDDFKLKYIDEKETRAPSSSYPNLISESKYYIFESHLSDKQFKPDGYIEEQNDKITYFTWELV